jgi:hypothetical protein
MRNTALVAVVSALFVAAPALADEPSQIPWEAPFDVIDELSDSGPHDEAVLTRLMEASEAECMGRYVAIYEGGGELDADWIIVGYADLVGTESLTFGVARGDSRLYALTISFESGACVERLSLSAHAVRPNMWRMTPPSLHPFGTDPVRVDPLVRP